MYLSCYDILPVQRFCSFGTDCIFCLSNKHAAVQLNVKNNCQILPTHLRWDYLKNKVMCLTERHIWLYIRHIWTISSTQPLAQNQYHEVHLLLSHTFLTGEAAQPSTGDTDATAIEKCLREVETGRKLLPKLLPEQRLWSHLPWCFGGRVLRTNIRELQRCLALEERSQAKSRADSQQTRLLNNNQLEKKQQIQPSSASYLTSSEKLCIYVVWNAAILVQGSKTRSPQGGQHCGAEEWGLFLAPLQLSCETSAKLLAPTLLYPFIAMLERHVKK